jgi:hypothetical protein
VSGKQKENEREILVVHPSEMPPEVGKRNGPAQEVAWYASKANKSTTPARGLWCLFFI